jgi:hypothetical protein
MTMDNIQKPRIVFVYHRYEILNLIYFSLCGYSVEFSYTINEGHKRDAMIGSQ